MVSLVVVVVVAVIIVVVVVVLFLNLSLPSRKPTMIISNAPFMAGMNCDTMTAERRMGVCWCTVVSVIVLYKPVVLINRTC